MAEFHLGTLSANPVGRRDSVSSSDQVDTYSFVLGDGNINIALTNMNGNADLLLFRDLNGDRGKTG